MPIVDFEQDPSGPLGTGNFRDDKGRVMYLHDPDTASKFIKTMPGQSLGGQVAAESDAAAGRQMGDPGATLGAQVATESDAITRARFGGQAPSRGQQLIAQLAQVSPAPGAAPDESSVASDAPAPAQGAPTLPGAAPAVPGAAPGGPTPAPAAAAAPAPPGGAPAPGGPGAALVQNVTAVTDQFDARNKAREVAQPKAYPAGKLPLFSVKEGESLTVDEGRPLENVAEQAGAEDRAFKANVEQPYLAAGKAKDQATDTAFKAQITGASFAYGQGVDEQFRKRAERREAERQAQVVQQEIKKNDTSLDPDRVVRQMSTGKKIGMIILAALNGAFGAVIGQKDNGVVTALHDAIDRDIDRQKSEVANRRVSLSNDYKRFLDLGLDAQTAEDLARHKSEAAMLSYKDLEAKRTNAAAQGAGQKEAELLLAPLRQAHTQRQGDLYASSEAKVKRTRDASMAHEVPPLNPYATPQGTLAQLGVDKERIEQQNAAQVGEVLGHPVSPEEAARLKQDAQEYALKGATNQTTKGQIAATAAKVGLRKGKDGWEKIPGKDIDPGVRPLGTSAFSAHAREVDRAFSALKEAKIMGAAREPANTLQREFGDAIARPFNDSDLPQYFNDLDALVDRSDSNLRKGYGEAATLYDRTPSGGGRPTPDAAPGKPKPASVVHATPAQKAEAERERKKTKDMMNAPGNAQEL